MLLYVLAAAVIIAWRFWPENIGLDSVVGPQILKFPNSDCCETAIKVRDYRRAEELLDEIRRRSAQQNRPEIERDYLRRLLDQF